IAGLIHIGEALSGNAEDSRSAASNDASCKALLIPRHAVVFVTHADVQCEIPADLPVVFEERAPFVLVKIAKFAALVPCGAGLLRTGNESQILRVIHEECLLNVAHAPGKIREQIPRDGLVSCDETGNGAVVDARHSRATRAECDDGIEVSGL